MALILAAFLALPASAADKTTIELAEYFLKVETADANPKLVEPFLAIDPETLPKRLRRKTRAKQLEIRALIKVHDRKKQGVIVQASEAAPLETFVHPFKEERVYAMAGFVPITEDEEKYVMDKTHCLEIDLGTQFSLQIFFEKGSKKPRRLMFYEKDPLLAIVGEIRGGGKAGGNTHFFGLGYTCQH